MSIADFIAVVSFGLTCFGLGYTIGKDSKSQAAIFVCQLFSQANRLSAALFFYNHSIMHL